jgi:hypothetical protein
MFVMTMAAAFKVGDRFAVKINGEPATVTWRDAETLVINDTDVRRIVVHETGLTDGLGRAVQTFTCTDAEGPAEPPGDRVRTFWMSFTHGDTGTFLGVAVIDVTEAEAAAAKRDIDVRFPQHAEGAEWMAAAQRKAWQLGCNPGGEIGFIELPPDHPTTIRVPRNRLLSKEELVEGGYAERQGGDHVVH